MRHPYLFAVALMVATALAFWPVRNFGFIQYDDPAHITLDAIYQPPTLHHLAYVWTYPFNRTPPTDLLPDQGTAVPPYKQLWGPLSFTVWGALAAVASEPGPPPVVVPKGVVPTPRQTTFDPAPFHSLNLLLHVLNAVLVFFLLRRLVKNEWAAAMGALLYGVHPLQVETVAWATAMNSLLSAFFGWWALLLFFKALDPAGDSTPAAPSDRLHAGWVAAATGCFALSLLAKPSSSIMPVLALVLLWGTGQRLGRARLLPLVFWALLAAADVVVNLRLQGDDSVSNEMIVWAPLRLLLTGDSFAFYFYKLLLPFRLVPDYGLKPHYVLDQWWGWVCWVLPVAVSLFLWRRVRTPGQAQAGWRLAAAGWGVFCLVLVQTSGIVPFYFHSTSLVADRYMYLALLGPALWLALLVRGAARGREPDRGAVPERGRVAAALVAGAVWAALTYNACWTWSSDTRLWQSTLAVNPRSSSAYRTLGALEVNRGHYVTADAIYERGLGYTHDDWQLLNETAINLRRLHQDARAVALFRESLLYHRWDPLVHTQLGLIAENAGDLHGAGQEFLAALHLAPDDARNLANVGVIAGRMGHPDEAIYYEKLALKSGFNPASVHLYWGLALAQQGHLGQAMEHWRYSEQLAPHFYETHYNMGLALLKTGDLAGSVRELVEALRLQPRYAPAHLNLARALALQGRAAQARVEAQRALECRPGWAAAKQELAVLGK